MLATPNSTAANTQSPRSMKNMQTVAPAPNATDIASISFLQPATSASAPRIGASNATTDKATKVVTAKRKLAAAGSNSAAATEAK